MQISILGILDDGWAGLSDTARSRLLKADLVIGAERTLELVRPYLVADCDMRSMDGALSKAAAWVNAAFVAQQSVVLLATGDPLCHGVATFLLKQLDEESREHTEILPAPSTLQIACARWKVAWQDVTIASCHSKDAGEWCIGATPVHGLYPLMRAIALNPRVCAFTSPENDPARAARALLMAGYGHDVKLSVACCLLLADERVYRDLTLSAAAQMQFPSPSMVLLERDDAEARPIFGLDDLEYIQRSPEKGLITKQEVRALSLAKLRLRSNSIVWDIGAGSGSVGLECAAVARNGHVWAIEKNPADADNARANAAQLRMTNYSLFLGKAPEHLASWPDPDAVFVGGSGGELALLISQIAQRLKVNGRLVMNFVTLENLATASATLKELGMVWDVVQLQASRSQTILDMHRLAAQNPVWIVTAWQK